MHSCASLKEPIMPRLIELARHPSKNFFTTLHASSKPDRKGLAATVMTHHFVSLKRKLLPFHRKTNPP
jgi:hypothetical protein